MIEIYCHPRCTTCKRAKAFLKENGKDFEEKNILSEHPNQQQLREWIALSGLPVRKFFNTSGNKYRELNLKEKLNELSEEEMIDLLAGDGMLVKRPLLIQDGKILLGFKEEAYKKL